MADNVQLNQNNTNGAIVRTVSDSNGTEWPVAVLTWATNVTPGSGAFSFVNSSQGLPVAQQGSWNIVNTNLVNSVTTVATLTTITNPVGVTGTFWQATQPVSGTFWQTTQPVSIAGTINSNTNASIVGIVPVNATQITSPWVVSGTVQANAGTNLNTSALALDTSINGLLIAQGHTSIGQSGPMVQGMATTNAPGYTTAQVSPLSLDTSGNLRVNVMAGGGTGGTSSSFNGAWPATGTAIGALSSNGVDMVGLHVDSSGNLNVNVAAGGGSGGTSSSFNGAWPGTGTAIGAISSNGVDMVGLHVDASGNLLTNGAGATQPISGTVAVNTLNVVNTVTTITNPVAVNATQITSPWVISGNITNANLVNTVTALTAITNALPAGTNLLGQISASAETNTLYSGTTALVPAFAAFTINANTTLTVVAGTTGKYIRVLRWSASFNGNSNIYWQSNTNTVQISGTHYGTQFATAGGAWSPVGIFQTAATGDSLQLVSSVNTNGIVSGELTYVKL
jgi:hypothetical protein